MKLEKKLVLWERYMRIHNGSKSESFLLVKSPKFCFKDTVNALFGRLIYEDSLKNIYNPQKANSKGVVQGKGTDETKKIGVYALFFNGELKKIGQAADNADGIFHRMSQYYRGKDGRCIHINENNRDNITVHYFNLETVEDCWAAERLLQGIAFYMGEKMPWEEKERHRGGK